MNNRTRDGTIEEWKDIFGYEGIYRISNLGSIYSSYYNRNLKPRINCKNGYKQVMLCKNKSHKMVYVHRLVAIHFVENDDIYNKEYINHKDEIKTNNNYDNLEWCTKEYNNTYNEKTQRCCKKVKQLDSDYNLIKIWNSAREASKELNLQYKNISAVAKNKRNYCGGFRWEFVK